ncbi:MAG: hypothetical protein J5884_05870 [Paludibacteraceae bacterium]|nr:hypothetical protein [Paludibacteraceae bacterium]
MKRFCIKFIALFIAIDSFLLFYILAVYPHLSGDMGFTGQIPFGQRYIDSLQTLYDKLELRVSTLKKGDSIRQPVVCFGDSFSRFRKYGYLQVVGEMLDTDIQDINYDLSPEQTFVQYANNELIPPRTMVILESVERSFVDRLLQLRLDNTTFPENNREQFVMAENENPNPPRATLGSAINYLRKRLHIKQPIHCYPTSADLFTHSSRHNQLYIYDSPGKWDNEGDLRFVDKTGVNYEQVNQQLYALHQLAEAHQLTLVYVVAADKYDVYEPFIVHEHPRNPTLDALPEEDWIVNTKPILQSQVYQGVKDIYYINDTHWSPVGAQIVGEEIANRLAEFR